MKYLPILFLLTSCAHVANLARNDSPIVVRVSTDFPITVVYALDDDKRADLLQFATHWWNTRLGNEALRWWEEGSLSREYAVFGNKPTSDDCKKTSAIARKVDDDLLVVQMCAHPLPCPANVMIHELGHVLGLGHSPKEDDIMYYRVGCKPYEVSEDQLQFVRESMQ